MKPWPQVARALSTAALTLLAIGAHAQSPAKPGAAVPREPLSEPLSFEAELQTAPDARVPGSNVGVHIPAGFDPAKPLHLVVFVHGLRGCLPVLLGEGPSRCRPKDAPQRGWNLGAHHDAAGTQSLLLVPALHYGVHGGQPGAFGKPGGFANFLDELLSSTLSPRLGRALTRADVASINLIAHSAGYETALAILEHGGVDSLVHGVVLLDALYAFEARYARYVTEHVDRGLRLIVIHLRGGRPAQHGQKLEQQLRHTLGTVRVTRANMSELRAAASAHAAVFVEGRPPHGRMPHHHMAQALKALDLPVR